MNWLFLIIFSLLLGGAFALLPFGFADIERRMVGKITRLAVVLYVLAGLLFLLGVLWVSAIMIGLGNS